MYRIINLQVNPRRPKGGAPVNRWHEILCNQAASRLETALWYRKHLGQKNKEGIDEF
jgi:hypothetical protein